MLIAEAAHNKVLKRELALKLSIAEGPKAVAKTIATRLNALARSTSFVDWRQVKTLERDLDQQRSAIIETIAPAAPNLALDLMWRFVDLAEATFERCDDSSGRIDEVFRHAVSDIGEIAERLPRLLDEFVDAVVQRLRKNGYGIFDDLVMAVLPAMDKEHVSLLKSALAAWQDEIGSDDQCADNEDHFRYRSFERYAVQNALQQVADAEGDVDAFIATHDPRSLSNPVFASAIALRLIAANRAEEALSHLDNAKPQTDFGIREWHDARIGAFVALNQIDQAQDLRWKMFQTFLRPGYLRAYLKELPDFDDVEAEDAALAWVETFDDIHRSLTFLIEWPSLQRAARVIEKRQAEIDGDVYYVLSPAADALEGKYPLAAVLLRRAMIETTLYRAKSKRYKHAARHVLEIESLDAQIVDYSGRETHQAFMHRLRDKHGRKYGFWGLLDGN